MKKSITITALAAYLLTILTSCGSAAPAVNDTTAAGTTGETTAASDEIPCPVEKSDFGGQEFRILYPEWFLYNDYFFVEEQSGDQMDDAIYERTVETEEHLNVKITPLPIASLNDIAGTVQAAVLAGDDAYDMVLTHCISGVGTMATNHYLLDWTTLSDITFDERWWNEDMNNELEVNGKRFYTVSDFMLGDPNAILFNKTLIDEYKLENPYDLVHDGKWTWDKLTEMSRNVSKDVDGNSVWDENDMYGFVAQAEWKMISIPYSCDQYVVKEEDGEYKLALNNEKMISIIDKMYDLFYGDNSSYIWVASGNVMQTGMITGRVLFDLAALNDSVTYRQSDVNFGILPFPKYDEAQEEYISLNWCGLMCIPSVAKSTEMIGKVCEMLAYASDDTTQPAYRETLLNGKLARDDESVGMLDIIFDTLVCDYGLNYLGFNDLTYTIPRMVGREKSTDFASWYDKNINTVQKTLDELNEALSEDK